MQRYATSSVSEKSHQTPAESTGKLTESSRHPASAQQSTMQSESVYEISDSENSDQESGMESPDEGDAIKREITARKTNRETLDQILDHSSGVCTLSSAQLLKISTSQLPSTYTWKEK